MEKKAFEKTLTQLQGCGLVIRNLDMAVEKVGGLDLSLDDKIICLFNQGRGIGVHIYHDVNVGPTQFFTNLQDVARDLSLKESTLQIIISNVSPTPHAELSKQELF